VLFLFLFSLPNFVHCEFEMNLDLTDSVWKPFRTDTHGNPRVVLFDGGCYLFGMVKGDSEPSDGSIIGQIPSSCWPHSRVAFPVPNDAEDLYNGPAYRARVDVLPDGNIIAMECQACGSTNAEGAWISLDGVKFASRDATRTDINSDLPPTLSAKGDEWGSSIYYYESDGMCFLEGTMKRDGQIGPVLRSSLERKPRTPSRQRIYILADGGNHGDLGGWMDSGTAGSFDFRDVVGWRQQPHHDNGYFSGWGTNFISISGIGYECITNHSSQISYAAEFADSTDWYKMNSPIQASIHNSFCSVSGYFRDQRNHEGITTIGYLPLGCRPLKKHTFLSIDTPSFAREAIMYITINPDGSVVIPFKVSGPLTSFGNIIFEVAPSATTTTTLATCDAFHCGDPEYAVTVPNAGTVYGDDFSTCCKCQYGIGVLWGAHSNATVHVESNEVEMWIEVPADVDMQMIAWENAQSDALQYTKGSSSEWEVQQEGECAVRYALKEDLTIFFSSASHFTYDRSKDVLEGGFEFEAERTMHRFVGNHEHSFKRHITQYVPVLFSLDKTAKVEATFSTIVTGAPFADIAITGIAEETFSENGQIVLNLNIISSSCMEKSVTLKEGNALVSGDLTVTWSDESMWHPDSLNSASCSQDCTIEFMKADGVFDLPLVFRFQIQAADNAGEYVDEAVNLHIQQPTILDSLPLQAQISFYFDSNRNATSDSFGLGHTVYGRIITTTVVTVDSISLTGLALEQLGYDDQWKTFDLLTASWSEYQGQYVAPDHFDFSFKLATTDLHITESGNDNHLAKIAADIEVTYLDGSNANRRRLAMSSGADSSMEASRSFRITASDANSDRNVAAILEVSPAQTLRALQWTVFGGLLILSLWCICRQLKHHQSAVYTPLMLDNDI